MADNTIIQQGHFTSDGTAKTIVLRSDIDWFQTWNWSTYAAGTINDIVMHYWQRSLPAGDAFVHVHTAGSNIIYSTTGLTLGTPQFTLIDSSAGMLGAASAVTAGTNATTPVYSAADTGIIAVGSIVRVNNTAHTNLNGLDFTVGAFTADTTFTLGNTLATAPGVIGGAGFYRYVAPDLETYKLFYPGNRAISNITAANPAVVTTLVDHGLTTGQRVRIKVPAANGMIQMNDLTGTATWVSAGTFSIDIDATAFTAFNFPLPAAVPYTNAEMIPVGQTPSATGIMGGATTNVGYIGMVLGAGQGSPAGVNTNQIKWRAGKSFAAEL